MKVRVYAYGSVRQAVGAGTLDLDLPEQSHFRDLIEQMVQRFGAPFQEAAFAEEGENGAIRIKPPVRVLVNGMALESLDGGNPPLSDKAEVAFLMMSAGG